MNTVADIQQTLQQLVPDEFPSLLEGLELPAAFDVVQGHLPSKRTRNTSNTIALFFAAKRTWNRMLPIHQLPAEILIMILLDVDDPDDQGIMERNHTFAQVCCHWRDLVIDSRLFWRRVSYDVEETVDVVIRRSGTGEVDIECNFTKPWTNPVDEQHFLNRTMALANRVKTLSFFGCNPDHSLQRDYIKAMSRCARSIVLSSKHSQWKSGILLESAAPTEALIIIGAPIQWSSTVFRHLRAIILHNVDLPSTRQLQAIVLACQTLEVVAFIPHNNEDPDDSLDPDGSLDESPTTTGVDGEGEDLLLAPRLRCLFLNGVPRRITSFFSHRVAAGACLHVHIVDDYERKPAFDWSSPTFKHLVRSPLTNGTLSDLKVTFIEETKQVTIEDLFYPRRIVEGDFLQELQELDQYSGLYIRVNLDFHAPNSVADLIHFLTDLPREISNLSLKQYEFANEPSTLLAGMEAFSCLTSVTHLTIEDESPDMCLLQYISTAQTNVGIPFPRLASIAIINISPPWGCTRGLEEENDEIYRQLVISIVEPICTRNRLAKCQNSGLSLITELRTDDWLFRLLEGNQELKEADVTLVLSS